MLYVNVDSLESKSILILSLEEMGEMSVTDRKKHSVLMLCSLCNKPRHNALFFSNFI